MKLVKNWQQAHKWLSVQIAALGAILSALAPMVPGAWEQVPSEWKAAVPAAWMQWGSAVFFVLVIVARLIDQNKGATDANNTGK